ncbi:hypothetical protein SPURM210S_06196 [Streptomyces purpurascens]
MASKSLIRPDPLPLVEVGGPELAARVGALRARDSGRMAAEKPGAVGAV